MKTRWVLLFVSSFALFPARSAAQVVQTANGPVEFIGLKRWTVEMIRDTMAVKAPGQPLGQCAAVLQKVGFPAASSNHIMNEDGTEYVVVTVVEPHDRARVREKPLFADSLPAIHAWHEATEIFRSSNRGFQRAVSWYDLHRSGDTTAIRQIVAMAGNHAAEVQQFWRFLDHHRSEADFQRAVWTLNNDGNVANRAVAAAILGSFGDHDLTWWTLLDAQRDPIDAIAGTAQQVLQSLVRAPKSVDWEPAQASLRHLLNGTNVFVFAGTLDVLGKTGINPALAPTLLRNGGADLLLAHLNAKHKAKRDAAHSFLVHLAGQDLGSDTAAWAQWIGTLLPARPSI